MRCIYCGNDETMVTNKRDVESETRRRRECLKCKKRFTTYERADVEISVIKKDGTREKYSRDKVLGGMRKACEKRSVSAEKIDREVAKIEENLGRKGKEVSSKIIGNEVMKSLKRLDKVAYIRFASVYRDFKDVSDFKKEIKEL